MTQLEHSKLPPSSAARRMACPGSRALCEQYQLNDNKEASQEGELAHECAASLLHFEKSNKKFRLRHAKECYYTQEMEDGAKLYGDIINRFLLDRNDLHIEERIDIDNVHKDMWGTPDAWGIEKDALHVFDYKYGFTPVEAFENWQLIAYASGIIKGYSEIKTICLHIIQPRDYVSSSKHKVWYLTADELEDYRLRLMLSETLSYSPKAELKVNAECKYCPARHACPALKQASFGAAELSFRHTPQGLDASQVGSELKLLHDARDLLEYRITALETEAQYFLQRGMGVDHYELAASEGRLNWSASKNDIFNVGVLHGINLKKEEIITPTQAIKAGLPEDEVLKLSERKQSLKLSKIDLNKSKKIFGGK